MKKFISILIALFAILTIQAQQYSLDKTYINTCVVEQHIDVGVTIQPTYIYNYTTLPAKVSVVVNTDNNTTYTPMTTTLNNYTANYYTSCTGYRRGVGLINTTNNYNYIRTSNLVNSSVNNVPNKHGVWTNIQKYYCN